MDVMAVGEVKETVLLLHKHTQLHPSEAAAEEVLGVFFPLFLPIFTFSI